MNRERKPPPKIDTKTARAKLPPADKLLYVDAARGCDLGYRKPKAGAGSWYVRALNGEGGYWVKRVACADDVEAANGKDVLSFAQALDLARRLGRGEAGDDGADSSSPLTVAGAVAQYAADLKARGGGAANATFIKFHMSRELGAKVLSLTTPRDWRAWRDGIVASGTIKPTSINRLRKSVMAAMNLAARLDARIAANAEAWRRGFEALPNADRARDGVVLDDSTIRAIVAGVAAMVSEPVALHVEILAQCGSRTSQVSRLNVGDLLDNDRLAMPSSKKGSSVRKIDRRPIPIGRSLWGRLQAAAGGRGGAEPLLQTDGRRVTDKDYREVFRAVVTGLGLDGAVVVPYCLRHSCIVRGLLASVPVRVIAAGADTSVVQIERNYSRFIADSADTVARRGLLDLGEDTSGNVVPLPRR
jgi:integrase